MNLATAESLVKCCGCIGIRTGCQVLGVLYLISGWYTFGMNCASLAALSTFNGDEDGYTLTVSVAWVLLFEGLINGLMAIMYLIAISKRNPSWMLYYVIWMGIDQLVVIAVVIAIVAVLTNDLGAVVLTIASLSFVFLIGFYYIYVINLYRKMVLTGGGTGPQVLPQPQIVVQQQPYSQQAYPQPQSYQGNPQPAYPQQGYPQQGYPQPGYPQQGNPQPGYPQQGSPQPGYPQQGYPQQGYPQVNQQSYPQPPAYGQQKS